MKVLVACEFSGIVRDAFIARGHDAWSCDLLPTEQPGPHLQGDVSNILDGYWDLMIAHPPCTRLTNSGVRWLHKPPPGRSIREMMAEFEQACAFYKLLQAAPIKLKAIENPIMHKYAYERIGSVKRQIVQPWWFGDHLFKATGFELFGLPELIPSLKIKPPELNTGAHKAWSAVHNASPGDERWKDRSRTAPGLASALADQWGTF